MQRTTWLLGIACVLIAYPLAAGCGARRGRPVQDDPPRTPGTPRLAGSVHLETWQDVERERDLPVQLRLPGTPEPWPLIVMSHGAGGNRTTGAYLAEALVQDGYVVVQVEHPGSNTAALQRGGKRLRRMRRNLQAMVQEPANWAHRPLDVSFVLDRILASPLATRLDTERIGICGHSYGAFTTMAIAGMTVDMPAGRDTSFRDPRVRAAVALSPQGAGTMGVDSGAWHGIAIPLLMVTGTEDEGLGGQPWTWRREPFDEMRSRPGPAYVGLATFEGAGHGSFGDGDGGWLAGLLMSGADDTTFHTAIVDTVLSSFRMHLDPAYRPPPPGYGGAPFAPHPADPDVRWSMEGVGPAPRR